MRESDIEQYLVKQVRAAGGEIRKVAWPGRVGAPDRLVMLPARRTWVEVKAPGESAKPHQIREHNRMRRMGEFVEVIDSIKAVDQLIGAST